MIASMYDHLGRRLGLHGCSKKLHFFSNYTLHPWGCRGTFLSWCDFFDLFLVYQEGDGHAMCLALRWKLSK